MRRAGMSSPALPFFALCDPFLQPPPAHLPPGAVEDSFCPHTRRAIVARRNSQHIRFTDMAQAIMNPEEVRRFAEELKRFNTDLQARMASLQARFSALGETWHDQEHVKFAEDFKATMRSLRQFVEASNQHAPFLLRKAQRIEEYLSQR
jgi:uncharacterized protein YukE